VILATILFLLYAASAWAMLRSVKQPRLEPVAWILILVAIIGHSDAIMLMMRLNGPFSIGLLEATSLLGWTLAVLADGDAPHRRSAERTAAARCT